MRYLALVSALLAGMVGGCSGSPAEKAAESAASEEAFSAPVHVVFTDEDQGAYRTRIRKLFEDEQFNAWEREAQAALSSTARFPDGLTPAEAFFDEMHSAMGAWNMADPFRFRESVEKWQKAHPESHAARIAMIYVFVDIAWAKRGGGFAGTVTDAGWKNFESYLRRAHEAYDACLRDGIDYPTLHARGLTIALGEGWSRAETEKVLLAGLEKDPLFQTLYRAMAWYLMPKWHGSNEEAKEFFYQARDLARPQGGGAMGFVVAWYFADQVGANNEGFTFLVPWHELHACYEDFASLFPNAMDAHNRMALFAVRYKKKAELAEIFRTAATDHAGSVWSRPAFDAWKAFALQDAPAPTHSELHQAAEKGDVAAVRQLLSETENVDILNGYGVTPLYYAVDGDELDIARLLLEAGANANAVVDGDGHTLLNVAVNRKNDAVATLLINHGADFDIEYSPGRPIFHRFFHHGMLQTVETFVRDHGGDVNLRDDSGYTGLHIVAQEGDVQGVRRLLELGAAIDAQTDIGMTPLLSAINGHHEECSLALVDVGADVTLTLKDGTTALIAAVDHRFTTLVQKLIEKGMDVNAKDLDGWTALHMATMNGDKAILDLLLKAPAADINIATNEGRTLMHQAAKSGHSDLLKLLVERGAEINPKNDAGKTPLALAMDENKLAAASYLESVDGE